MLPADINPWGISKSAMNRGFVAGTQELLQDILNRPLDQERYLVLFVDGVQLGKTRVICALGITYAGEKRVLGLWEGDTENAEVCTALLEDIITRGFSASNKKLMVVIDGSKALYKAVRTVWGDDVFIQRCQAHKKRNVLDKLPEDKHEWVGRKLSQAWNKTDAVEAETDLLDLAVTLEESGYSEAGRSIREGLHDTLTCMRLDVPPVLRDSLETTNIIENAFSQLEIMDHRVKHWKNGNQALRWAAAALLTAEEKSFKPLKGHASLPQLAHILERQAGASDAGKVIAR